jgi:hypothetical protein
VRWQWQISLKHRRRRVAVVAFKFRSAESPPTGSAAAAAASAAAAVTGVAGARRRLSDVARIRKPYIDATGRTARYYRRALMFADHVRRRNHGVWARAKKKLKHYSL